VLLTTPTTPTDRMKEIAKASEGFLYLVSVQKIPTICLVESSRHSLYILCNFYVCTS